MSKKNAFFNILSDILSKIVTLILGIILPKLYIDTFGSEVNGLLSSISGLLIYVNLLEAGVGGASIQALYGALVNKNRSSINSILSATDKFYKRTGIYFLAIISIIAFIYPLAIKSDIEYITVVFIILLSAIPSAIKYLFQGKFTILLNADNKAYILNLIYFAFNTLSNIAKIVLICLNCNVIYVQISFAIISLLQMILIYLYIKRKYPYLNLKVKPDYKSISKRNYVMIHTISSTIFSNTDVLVLTIFCGLKVVSIYTIYNMIFNQINQILKSFSNGFSATFGQYFQKDKDLLNNDFDKVSVFIRFISISLITITGILTIPFLILYTSTFNDAGYIDYILALLFMVLNFLDVIRWPEVVIINACGYFKETIRQSLIETIINVICSVIFVNMFGIYGVLIGTIIALIYRSIEMIIFTSKNILKTKKNKTIIYIYTSLFISILMLLISKKYMFICRNYYNLIILAIIISIFVFIVNFIITSLFYKNVIKHILFYIVDNTNKSNKLKF